MGSFAIHKWPNEVPGQTGCEKLTFWLRRLLGIRRMISTPSGSGGLSGNLAGTKLKGCSCTVCAGSMQGLYAQPIHSDERLHIAPLKRQPISCSDGCFLHVHTPFAGPNHIKGAEGPIQAPLLLQELCRCRAIVVCFDRR